jgi:hypothetical protein
MQGNAATVSNALRSAMAGLKNDAWDVVFDSLNILRRLALHHSPVVVAQLHGLVLLLIKQVHNLRSSVAKNALLTLQDCCSGLGKHMDSELADIVPNLMKLASEKGTGFISEESERVLHSMLEHCSDTRLMSALISSANHKNPQVRAKTASYVDKCLARMGPRVVQDRGVDKIVSVAVSFLGEAQPMARNAGKRIMLQLHRLGAASDKVLRRALSDRDYRKVVELVEKERKTGFTGGVGGGESLFDGDGINGTVSRSTSRNARRAGSAPKRSSSSSSNSGGGGGAGGMSLSSEGAGEGLMVGGRGASRTNASSSSSSSFRRSNRGGGASRGGGGSGVGGVGGSGGGGGSSAFTSSAPVSIDPVTEEEAKALFSDMDSSDWRVRQQATTNLGAWLVSTDTAGRLHTDRHTVVAFDRLVGRLADSNSRVTMTALEVSTKRSDERSDER